MVQKKVGAKKSPAQRRRDLEREVAARGFKPLTEESLAKLAMGTAEETEDLLQVSAEIRRRGRERRRSS